MAEVELLEHLAFKAALPKALGYLASRHEIDYQAFLDVHRILFSAFYPWAGTDRRGLGRTMRAVRGDAEFCDPKESHRSIAHGILLAVTPGIAQCPGAVMAAFAYAHPFLDGNGRTILLVHQELCHRADFSIAWEKTNKLDYLTALTLELAHPRQKHLDDYLKGYVRPAVPRGNWARAVAKIQGLGGDLNAKTLRPKSLKR